jgi:putative transposase
VAAVIDPFSRRGVDWSMSRSGNCWDNAIMESIFSSLKIEWIGKKVYRSRAQAKADVFDYIESFYNPTRHPSPLQIRQKRRRKAALGISEAACVCAVL